MAEGGAKPEIVATEPEIPSFSYMFMLEAMTYKATLLLPAGMDPREVEVQAWTSQCSRRDAEGNWHAQDLELIDSENGLHTYGKSIIITSAKDFRFTFRFRLRGEDEWQWSHGWMEDGTAHVEPPRMGDRWTQGIDYTHIHGAVHLGNFMASVHAPDPECSFTHVLNVADNLDMVYPKESSVHYLKIPMHDGAHNPIDINMLHQAISFVMQNDKPGNKLLIHCRAGIGRAGSVTVGFVMARHPSWTFEEAYDFVYERRFVYPHAQLKQQLHKLFPRQTP